MGTITAPSLTEKHRLEALYAAGRVQLIMADMVSLRRFCDFIGDVSGSGTDTLRVLYGGWGPHLTFETLAEGVGTATAKNLSLDYADIDVDYRALEVTQSFKARLTERSGDVGLDTVIDGAVQSWEATFTNELCSLFPSLTTIVGTSGVDASMDDFYDATFEFDLEDGADGPLVGALHGRQIADLKTSKRGEPAEWIKDESQLAFKAPGFQGNLLGVDVIKTNRVTAAGGNRLGAIWMPGTFGYDVGGAEGLLKLIRGAADWMIMGDPPILIVWGRNDNGGILKVNMHTVFGMGILGTQGQRKGVQFRTDQ
jgi:hypothetical protein